jgi:acetolactate decarboxylase
MHSISVPGFHLHFLSADKNHGGHLLDCLTGDVKVSLQPLDRLSLDLPHTIEYLKANLDQDTSADLNKAEH